MFLIFSKNRTSVLTLFGLLFHHSLHANFCSELLEPELAQEVLTQVVLSALESGALSEGEISHWLDREIYTSPFSSQSASSAQIPYQGVLNQIDSKDILWERVRERIRFHINQEKGRNEKDSDAVQSLFTLVLEKEEKAREYPPYKTIQNLHQIDSPERKSVLYARVFLEDSTYFARYDPVNGLDSTLYPVSNDSNLPPFLVIKDGLTYLGAIQHDKIIFYHSKNELQSTEAIATPDFEIPLRPGGIKKAYIEHEVKVFYIDGEPVIHYIVDDTHVYRSIITSDERDRLHLEIPIDPFEASPSPEIIVQKPLKKLPKRYRKDSYNGNVVHLYRFSPYGAQIDNTGNIQYPMNVKSYIGVHWLESGYFQKIELPPLTRIDVDPVVFESEGRPFLAAYVNESEHADSQPTRSRLLFYNLQENRWEDSSERLGRRGVSNGERSLLNPLDPVSLKKVRVEGSDFLILTTTEVNQDKKGYSTYLVLYSYDARSILSKKLICDFTADLSLQPVTYQYEDDGEIGIIVRTFSSNPRNRISHFKITR